MVVFQEGKITFKSTGFKQFVRQKPIFTYSQILSLEDRNGISFSEKTFDECNN